MKESTLAIILTVNILGWSCWFAMSVAGLVPLWIGIPCAIICLYGGWVTFKDLANKTIKLK